MAEISHCLGVVDCTLDGFPKFQENVGNSTGCARLSLGEIVSVLERQLEIHGNG
jgi:hypothetical protein